MGAVTNHPQATLTINDSEAAIGTTRVAIALAEEGSTTITIVVTAEDGTTNTYGMVVAAPIRLNLENVDEPIFAGDQTTQTISVPFGTTKTRVSSIFGNLNTMITVTANGKELESANDIIQLREGATNTITIEVDDILIALMVNFESPPSTVENIRIRAKVFLEGPLQ